MAAVDAKNVLVGIFQYLPDLIPKVVMEHENDKERDLINILLLFSLPIICGVFVHVLLLKLRFRFRIYIYSSL